MSDTHTLNLPLARADVDRLNAGDMVLLNGLVTMTIGLPTHQRMMERLDAGRPLPVDLKDGAFLHLSCFNRELTATACTGSCVRRRSGACRRLPNN